MTATDLRDLREQISDLTTAVLRLEAAVELLRQHLVNLGQRTTALEVSSITPPPGWENGDGGISE